VLRPAHPLQRPGELKELRRTGTVEEYERQFLALLCRCDNLTPPHQLDLFTAGLGQPLASDVEMQRPSNLQTALSLTRAFELRSKEAERAISATPQSFPRTHSAPTAPPSSSTPPKQEEQPRPRFLRLSAEEMAEKRASGLCYFCPEKFSKDHKCAGRGGAYCLAMDDETGSVDIFDEDVRISLHALNGITSEDTIRLRIRINGVELTALVDSGSTHTFIHADIASRLGLDIKQRQDLQVKAANGEHISSPGVCAATTVNISGEPFSIDCYALALDSFDLVLGVKWLKTLGPITWDFTTLTMAFQYQGRAFLWHDIGGQGISLAALTATRDLMTALLLKYDVIFMEPHGLPPPRQQDHRIHLLPGSTPAIVRPYRYPQLLKDEIERRCEDMLAQGIICPSTSPFFSPVLLVRKPDGSWRFCVDYRKLNNLTVKDKFPIPVVDELLDELRGAMFFTKIDLRSGYHLVRMYADDIAKTAFQTHNGHFKFLVMPFGVTNAPATIQALMNTILKPFLCRFVLVFFDDILIYNSSWSEHLQRVEEVFQTLQAHNLFAKKSKCFFGESSMAYLGHIISEVGVDMDPTKVAAIDSWPRPCTVRAVRGFLGPTGYYRKFIAGYGVVAEPLTALLKGDAFRWSNDAERAFLALKQALMTAPVLHIPYFSRPFMVDCDASGAGFGAVLHQGDGPITFFSWAVAPHHAKLPAYERELIGLVKVVRHWRPYLWGRPFTVRTDHQSLKFLLDQRLSTIPQHTWVSKLLVMTSQWNIAQANLMLQLMHCLVGMRLLGPSMPCLCLHLRFSMFCEVNCCRIVVLLNCGHNSKKILLRKDGLKLMDFSCSKGVLMFQINLPCGSKFWLMHMMLVMKAFRRLCIVFAYPSTIPMLAGWFVIM
jgi:hypothetical protein